MCHYKFLKFPTFNGIWNTPDKHQIVGAVLYYFSKFIKFSKFTIGRDVKQAQHTYVNNKFSKNFQIYKI